MPLDNPATEGESGPDNRGMNEREAAAAIENLDFDMLDVGEDEDRRRKGASSDEDNAEPQGDDDELEDDETQSSDDTDDGEEEEPDEETDDDESEEDESEEDGSDEETDSDETDEDSEITLDALGIEELAEALEIPQEQLQASLTGIAKIDGQDTRVTFEEALAGYQRNVDYTQSKQQLTDDRRSFDEESTNHRQMYERNNMVLATTMQNLQRMFLAPPDPAEMERLRFEDTAEFTARTVEYEQRVKMFNDVIAGAANHYEEASSAQKAQMQTKASEWEKEQRSILAREVPGWNDAKQEQLYARGAEMYGFTIEEAKTVKDARTLKMLSDAIAFHDLKAAGEDVKQKAKRVAKKLPKNVGKPGKKTNRSKAQLKADNVRSAKARLRKSGKVRDAADAIGAQLGLD